jgi:cytochrome c oxidase subunit 2
MPRTAVVIAVLFAIATVVACALGYAVWRSTRHAAPVDERKLAETERTWLVIVVGILLAILFGTIFATPYGNARPGAQVVNVTAQQFAWTFDRQIVQAGKSVEFRLTSRDVNHGFGVYDAHHNLVFQVQVVPGKTQLYRHTFTKPGRYFVLCLEFCGVDHHLMTAGFEVTA